MIRSLIGHEDAVAALNRSLAEDRVAHAYLFAGPYGVGKATLARALAKALNCREPNAPCDACSTCRRIDAGKHPDVETMRPGGICEQSEHDHSAEAGRDIRICQIRRAERVLGIAPFEGGRRVLIVDPADSMNAQSADAFLKTLEEPPNGAVVVLVSADEGGLSETIRSRCRRVPLRPLPVQVAERALVERFGASAERAARHVRLFGGRIGLAVAALNDSDWEARRAAMLDLAAEVAIGSMFERFSIAERLADAYARRERPSADAEGAATPSSSADGKPRSRADVFAALELWTEWWRDLLLLAGDIDAEIVNQERRPALRECAAALGVAAAAAGVRALREARRDLEQNVNSRIALEALMLRLPRGNRESAVGSRERERGTAAPQRGMRPAPDCRFPIPSPGG